MEKLSGFPKVMQPISDNRDSNPGSRVSVRMYEPFSVTLFA